MKPASSLLARGSRRAAQQGPRRRARCIGAAVAAAIVALATLVAAPGPTRAAEIAIVNADGAGEGLNDPTPASPVGGNPGTTLGQLRANVVARAAADWGARLRSDVPIEIEVRFDALFCAGTSATLGSSGPPTALRDFDGAPRPGTWYAPAVANALAGKDLAPDSADVVMTLSGRLGTAGCGLGWYYGLDRSPPPGSIDLYAVAVHEIAHGLGFVPFFDPGSGAKLLGRDDAYLANLLDASTSRPLSGMTDSQRAAACVKPEQLHWLGQAVTAAGEALTAGVGPAGRVHMYSPAILSPGSSVSHFSTSLVPSDVMEPFYVGPQRDLSLAAALLSDVGWPGGTLASSCVPSDTAICLQGGRFRVEVQWRDFVGQGGAAHTVAVRTPDSGLFWFYGADNWELLVKVLDGCGQNDRYWVFAAAATALQYRITVTDTHAGQQRSYSNPLGVSSPAVTDVEAFACP
jgi:hypothetical protein